MAKSCLQTVSGGGGDVRARRRRLFCRRAVVRAPFFKLHLSRSSTLLHPHLHGQDSDASACTVFTQCINAHGKRDDCLTALPSSCPAMYAALLTFWHYKPAAVKDELPSTLLPLMVICSLIPSRSVSERASNNSSARYPLCRVMDEEPTDSTLG